MGRGSTLSIISLVFFVLLSALTGIMGYRGYMVVESKEGDGNIKGNREVYHALKLQRETKTKEVQTLSKTLAKTEKKLDLLNLKLAKTQERLRAAEVYEVHTKTSKKFLEELNEKTVSTCEKSTTTASEGKSDYEQRKTSASKLTNDRIAWIIKRITTIAAELEKFKADNDKELNQLETDKGRLSNELSDLRQRISELISREAPSDLPAIGRILTSDPERDLAVINLGSRHGVKPGMRFLVYHIENNNKQIDKGFLEVKTVRAEVSTCNIMVKEVRLPRCPICGYTGTQPEQKYCPRCTSPGSAQDTQRLNSAPKIVDRGKSLTKPILKGDMIFNPFLSPGKTRKYAVSGKSLVPLSTAYNAKAVKRAIEFHGNTVDTEVSARTNVLVALRGGEEAVAKAMKLGITIVRGHTLFRYLEK
jgi:hypothetical protein